MPASLQLFVSIFPRRLRQTSEIRSTFQNSENSLRESAYHRAIYHPFGRSTKKRVSDDGPGFHVTGTNSIHASHMLTFGHSKGDLRSYLQWPKERVASTKPQKCCRALST